MPDCPHIHIQDSGLQAFKDIILEETDGGRNIARFLNNAMEGELSDFEPQHRLKAAEILVDCGSEEAAEYVRANKTPKRRRSTTVQRDPAQSESEGDRDPITDPFKDKIARAIREETNNGLSIVRNLIQIMETHEEPYKPHHNLAAAKQLIERGFPLTDALICHPDCSHHAVEKAVTPADTTDDTDSTEKETVPDPKWLEAITEVQRMKDEGILTPDPNAPKIDHSIYMTGTEEEIAPYADEVAAAFRAELELQAERQAMWPEIEERRRKKLAQTYPSHSDGDPPDT